MAISVNTVLEVRSGGSDTNGGGFVTGASGTDWSQQDAAQYAVADGVTAGTTTIISATANFGTDVVGNLIYVTGGTGSVTAAWYEIVSRTNSTTIVVDRSTGLTAGTGVTLNIGGGLATPGQAGAIKVAGNKIFIKYNATPYTLSSASANVAGGTIDDTTGGVDGTAQSWWVGYDTTRTVLNTDANRPTLKIPAAGVSSVTVVNVGNVQGVNIVNLIVDGNSKTSIIGINNNFYFSGGLILRCKAINCTTYGIASTDAAHSNAGSIVACEATTCSGTAAIYSASTNAVIACYSHDNTTHGFSLAGGYVSDCIADSNSGGSSDGFTASSASPSFFNCVAYNNGRDGFRNSGGFTRSYLYLNCIAVSNAGYGFNNGSSAVDGLIFILCATYSNTSGAFEATLTAKQGCIALSGDPFTSSAGGDFSLNNTAGAGASCRAAGFPGVFPGGTTTGYLSIGAVEPQASGGGGGGANLLGNGTLTIG